MSKEFMVLQQVEQYMHYDSPRTRRMKGAKKLFEKPCPKTSQI
jgi:hypothetical protein